MSEPERLEATVIGRVQGVGFRVFILRRASALGLVGWVANTPTRGVAIVAEGPREGLDELASALRSGPPSAVVEHVAERWGTATGGFTAFSIRSGAHTGD